MKIADFYNSPTVIKAFGKTRVYETIRHIKQVWPGFIPTYSNNCNEFVCAWILFILCKSRNTTPQAVRAAIIEGRELKRDEQPFIIWLAELLKSPTAVQSIQNIWVFDQGDSCVMVTNKDGSVKIFQGQERANTVRRAAIMDAEFVSEISEMLVDSPDESLDGPVFEYDAEKHPHPGGKPKS